MARSSTEAEYRSLAQATTEVTWIQTLLTELSVPFQTPEIYRDNQSAVAISHNPVLHSRTKHMEIDFFVFKDKVLAKELKLYHIPSIDQRDDALTASVTNLISLS